MSRTRKTLWQIFRAPLLLALLSIIGLVAALIGDGLLDVLSWLTLGSTLAVIAWYWSRRSG
ncbi:hypothetical protein [Halopseudomonas maritima]|uniref:hypothetical protein n=1 Tax=Halopseudomonas maritima TaxID=2918528 RepID=UPI001EEA4EFD|nr:hypothetical protein [Halopseudomonas maritima]UJJ30615.1 hypothetical protein HV822_12620 [Halopseudomonas maritima]